MNHGAAARDASGLFDGTGPVHALLVVESATDAAPELARVATQALRSREPVFLHLDPATLEAVLAALTQPTGAGLEAGPEAEAWAAAGASAAAPAPPSSLLTTGSPPDLSSPPAAVLDDSIARLRDHIHRGAWTLTCEPSVSDRVWHEWLRVEAAVNVLVPQPRRLCVYERRQVGERRLEALEALHPQLVRNGRWWPSDAYQAPADGLGWPLFQDPPPDLPSLPVRLADPSPAELRSQIRTSAATAGIHADDVDALAFAATEALTNADRHGTRPVAAGVWPTETGMIVGVSDAGPGPDSPFLGLRRGTDDDLPADGMWAVHRLVDVHHTLDGAALRGGSVRQAASAAGYAVYLSVGHPRSPK